MISIDPFSGRTLEQFDRDWESAFNRGDHVVMAASYAEDARLIAAHMQTIVGRSHIAAFWQEACEGGKAIHLRRTVHTEQADVSEHHAYLYGAVTLMVAGRSPVFVRFVTVWKREPDGVWRIAIDISTPAPAHGELQSGAHRGV